MTLNGIEGDPSTSTSTSSVTAQGPPFESLRDRAMNLMNKTESFGLLDFVKVLEEKLHLRFAEGAEA